LFYFPVASEYNKQMAQLHTLPIFESFFTPPLPNFRFKIDNIGFAHFSIVKPNQKLLATVIYVFIV